MLARDDLTLRLGAAYSSWANTRPRIMAVDTETTGLSFDDKPFCVTVAWKSESGQIEGHYLELEQVEWPEDARDLVRTMLDGTPHLVFHNAKFDMQKLLLLDLMLPRGADEFEDTETLAHLIDEHQRLGLKSLTRELLGHETDEEEQLKAVRRKLKLRKEDGYHMLPRNVLLPYAVKDAEFTLELYYELVPHIAPYPDLIELYRLEKRLCITLGGMEARGMQVDVEYLKTTARDYASRALRAEVAIREMVGNPEFNPNSPKQLLEALAERGSVVDSTNRETLETLDDELAQLVLELRSLRKIHGTYLVALLEEEKGGIVHPWFRSNGTRTGRMSSGGATA